MTKPQHATPSLLLGAHTSTSGGLYRALLEGHEIGASTVQLFTANQRQWRRKPLTEESVTTFHETRDRLELSHLMSHASYLINPGSPNLDTLEKSRQCLYQEIRDCIELGITFVNFHPGATLGGNYEECLDRIISSFTCAAPLFEQPTETRILLEATAGQGSLVGHRFEDLAYLITGLKNTVPIGVCIDTCHIFAAGYDIRSPEAWDETLRLFDNIVGLDYLYAIHVNDSKFPLGSRKDRHMPLGEGYIGLESFQYMMQNPHLRNIPKYLETPGGPDLWEKEIRLLKQYA